MSHNEELVSYIINQLRACVEESRIVADLEKSGWHISDIQEALKVARLPEQNQTKTGVLRVDFTGTSQHTIAPIHKGKKKYIATLGILVFLIAGGVFAYTRYTQSPSRILSRMLTELSSVQSIEATSSLLIAVQSPPHKALIELVPDQASSTTPLDEYIKISTSQFMNLVQQNNDSFKFSLAGEYGNSAPHASPIHISLDSFGIKNTIYAKVAGISDVLSRLFKTSINLTSFENKWFSIDKTSEMTSIDELSHTFKEPTSSTNTPLTEENSSTTNKKEQALAIFNKYKTSIISTSQNLGEENLDGTPTTHILATLDEKQTQSMIREYDTLLNTTFLKNTTSTPLHTIDVWIDTDTYLPHQLRASLDDSFISELSSDISPAQIKQVTLEMSDAKYNTPLSLTPPENAKNLEEVLDQLFMTVFGGMQNSKTKLK